MAKPRSNLKVVKPEPAFIQTLIKVEGEKHPLEKIMDEDPDDMPVMKSVGYMKIDQNKKHSWVSYVLTTKGKEVISMEVSEPDMRDIAEETSKINFVEKFIDSELL